MNGFTTSCPKKMLIESIILQTNSRISLVLNADNQSAIDLCQYWRRALHGDKMAWVKVASFVSGIIATIEMHLEEEGINPYEN